MSRLPLHPLQGFVLAARLRNLSRAAEGLHLTVSALSHQIRALEQRLGQRLFERGVLSLSLLPSMASSWLVPRLGDFLAQHPQLEINLQSSVALVDFERETGIDAALRYGPGHWAGLSAVHLFDDWITPLASPQLVARHGGQLAMDDLGRYPLLDDRVGRWNDWFARFGGQAPKRFVAAFDDAETLHRAASSGLGVAMGRLTLARPLIDAGLLVELSAHRLKSEFAHYLVYPARSADHAGLMAFGRWLQTQAQAYAQTLSVDPARPQSRPSRPSSPRRKPRDNA